MKFILHLLKNDLKNENFHEFAKRRFFFQTHTKEVYFVGTFVQK